jgi:general secretion pathway protein E
MKPVSAIPSGRPRFSEEYFLAARSAARAAGTDIVDHLEAEFGGTREQFVRELGGTLGYPVLSMEELHGLEAAFDVLPFTECMRRGCFVFRQSHGEWGLVFGDPFAPDFRTWASETLPVSVSFHLAHRRDIAAYLTRQEETVKAMDLVIASEDDAGVQSRSEEISLASIGDDASPVVKLVNSTIYDALKAGASDIHLRTSHGALIIKYRLDGVLSTVATVPGIDMADQVISRIKVMSQLDITERRIPQDGRFHVQARGREVDFRVSIMPSSLGEDAVLRILDKRSLTDEFRKLRLEQLGFDSTSLAAIRKLANEPYGMFLVTGPTGSGKTTTLYASISEINHGRDNIVTIEDPVEYELEGVLQIPVNEKKGLTFARGLRSLLRHDPDKIMVGEIRDPETAQIAVQAALTGHLVFTTIHANNVFDVIGRFAHMNVDPFGFISAVNGVLAQRLVRVSCMHCLADVRPSEQELRDSGIDAASATRYSFKAGRACGECRGTGYKGRRAIGELLLLDDDVRQLILERAPLKQLKQAAANAGTRFLREQALDLVRTGVTTLSEANRVTLVA